MGDAKLDMTATVYAQSQESKVIDLLDHRWLRLGFRGNENWTAEVVQVVQVFQPAGYNSLKFW